jgi:hypothetical protein
LSFLGVEGFEEVCAMTKDPEAELKQGVRDGAASRAGPTLEATTDQGLDVLLYSSAAERQQ